MKLFNYKAFDLVIGSNVDLGDLEKTEEQVDVTIEVKYDIEFQNASEKTSLSYGVDNNRVVFRIPNVANFFIADGNKIDVESLPGIENKVLKLFLLGSCMGAILLQRGVVPLHGSALNYRNKGLVIVGLSGSGKSTLSSALIAKGAKLVSDDVIPCKLLNGFYYAFPSIPQQKLSSESMDVSQVSQASNVSVPYISTLREKFYIDRRDQFQTHPFKIDIVINVMQADCDEVFISEVFGMKKLEVLLSNVYRDEFVNGLGMKKECFSVCAKIAQQSKVFTLKRPRQGMTIDRQIELVEESFESFIPIQ